MSLGESRLPGIDGDRLEASDGVYLRKLIASGPVRLLEARISGTLDCQGAVLTAGKGATDRRGFALSIDSVEAKGSISFKGATIRGEVRLLGATIGGDLVCEGATFEGPKGCKPDGGIPSVLSLGGAKIGGVFFLRRGTRVRGVLDLTGAEIGALCDDREAWPPAGGLLLDSCRYGAFAGGAPVDAAARLEWLGRMEPARWGVEFWPQPYDECAKELREKGYGEAARTVAREKDWQEALVRLRRYPPALKLLAWVGEAIYAGTIDRGRQPLRAFAWLILFLVIGTAWFRSAEANDALKPNVPVLLRSVEWVECQEGGRYRANGESRMACFLRQPAGASYPQFNAFVYSADTLLPIVSLEMQGFWIPDDRTGAGWWARAYLWVHIVVGWALSLLAVAGFSGLVKSD